MLYVKREGGSPSPVRTTPVSFPLFRARSSCDVTGSFQHVRGRVLPDERVPSFRPRAGRRGRVEERCAGAHATSQRLRTGHRG